MGYEYGWFALVSMGRVRGVLQTGAACSRSGERKPAACLRRLVGEGARSWPAFCFRQVLAPVPRLRKSDPRISLESPYMHFCPNIDGNIFGRFPGREIIPWLSLVTLYVIWYDEMSNRRNTAGQTCTVDTCRPRRHVPLSPRSSCNRGSPGVSTDQAVLNQWVSSRTRHLSTFCSRSFRCFTTNSDNPSRASKSCGSRTQSSTSPA
jgi:hypothetical protein